MQKGGGEKRGGGKGRAKKGTDCFVPYNREREEEVVALPFGIEDRREGQKD